MRERLRWPRSMTTQETAMRTKGICQRRTSRQQHSIIAQKTTPNSSRCSIRSPRTSATQTRFRTARAETSHRPSTTEKRLNLHVGQLLL